MSRSSTLIVLGVLVLLVPFSGLPEVLRTLAAIVLGAIVLGLGVAERANNVREARASHAHQEPPAPATPEDTYGVSPI